MDDEKSLERFTYGRVDRDGRIPNLKLIGKRFRHSGNEAVYEIVDFVWNGETDLWHVVHSRPGSDAHFTRSIGNFFGMWNNVPRYTPVD